MSDTKKNDKAQKTDILIVGGGMAGLTLGVLLGRAGAAVRIVDPAPPAPVKETKPSGRTVALMVSSLNVLRAAGVGAIEEQYGAPLETMRIIDDSIAGGKTIETEFDAAEIGLPHFSMNIPNAPLRAALYEEAQKLETVTLHVPRKLEDFEIQETGIAATLDDGTKIQTPLIVGADGRDSLVRRISGIGARKKEYSQSAVTCIINHSRAHNNTATEFHRPSGPLALVPMPGNQSSVVWVERTARADEIMALPKDAFIRTLQDATNDILGGITLETGPECWPLCTIKAKALTAPRVALIAEAAHVMSPITAQGLNLSLRDVAALAETVIDAMRLGLDHGSAQVLKTYASRRATDISTRVFGVDAMNRFVSTDFSVLKETRRAGLSVVNRLSPLRHIAMTHGLAPALDHGRLVAGKTL